MRVMSTDDSLMRVLAWNLKHERSRANWKAFGPEGDYRCDIALLNEARRPPDGLGLNIVTRGRTVGRDDVTYGGKKPGRPWATAIASPYPLQRPKDVWTERPSRTGLDKDRRSKLMESRRGAWTAAIVSFRNGEKVTAISLYGLLDERSDASVHRSLSDLTPLLEDPRYNELLFLGGDLNPLWSAEVGSATLARVQGGLRSHHRRLRSEGPAPVAEERVSTPHAAPELHLQPGGRLPACLDIPQTQDIHARVPG